MSELQLFPDEGVCRPPGVPETARPDDGCLYACPACAAFPLSLYWATVTFARCERHDCGYVWTRSGQLHHSENLPI